jgi:small-conductance mechanosensitive channel
MYLLMNEYTIFGNSLQRWLLSICLIILVYLLLLLIKKVFEVHVSKWAANNNTQVDDFVVDLIVRTKKITMLVVALYIAVKVLTLNSGLSTFLRVATMLVLLLQSGFWASELITYLIQHQVSKRLKTDAGEATTLSALGTVAKGVVWCVLLVMALDNIPGVEVSTLIAGLGIGGIAIGLAVQNILGDLLASLSIVLDRPFIIGDFILVGDLMGTVEHIGVKSTRLRSLTGEQLVFSNSDLLASRIRNYQRMERRRVVFELKVTYQTPYEKLAAIPAMLQQIIDPKEGITFERAHFKSFTDSALSFEVVYWIEKSDYQFFMDQQQAINLELVQMFHTQDIHFAYPTQMLYMEKGSSATQ